MNRVTLVKFNWWWYWFFNKELDEKEKDKYSTLSVIEIDDEEYRRINDTRIKFAEVEEWVKSKLKAIRI